MKFYDSPKTASSEGVSQEHFHWSRAKERGSKMIRYRCSPFRKRWEVIVGDSTGSAVVKAAVVLRHLLRSGRNV